MSSANYGLPQACPEFIEGCDYNFTPGVQAGYIYYPAFVVDSLLADTRATGPIGKIAPWKGSNAKAVKLVIL